MLTLEPTDGRMRFRCVDTETTGIPDDTDPHAMVEIGFTDVLWCPCTTPLVLEPRSMLVNPGRPIPPEASAIHHLRDVDVEDATSPTLACRAVMMQRADYYVAHKIEFERQFFGGGATPWICTHKVSVRVVESPNHQVQTLRYFWKVDDAAGFEHELAMPPHRAGPDSYVLAFVFAGLTALATIAQMVRWSSGPALLPICWLPKHKGKRWSEVAAEDRKYLDWIVDKSDCDRDIKGTARYWLKQTERT